MVEQKSRPSLDAKGPTQGTLELEVSGEGSQQRTKAKLSLTWEGGSADVPLGQVPGQCSEVEPTPLPGQDGESLTPVWAISCTAGDKAAKLAIVQSKGGLFVRRAPLDASGAAGSYKTVKRVPLGADVVVSQLGSEDAARRPAPAPEEDVGGAD